MECLLAFFVLLVMITIAVRLSASSSSRSSRRRSYQLLAREFSGVYLPGGLFGTPKVRLRYGETIAFVSENAAFGPYRGRCTQVHIAWPDSQLRAEIVRSSGATETTAGHNRNGFKTGDDKFDRAFTVRGDDAKEVRQLLNDGVRWQIQRLRQLLGDDELYVLFTKGRIYVQKPRILRKYRDLKELVQRSLELYDQAMITRAVGIEFVESDRAQTLDDVTCQVCRDNIEADMVYCQRCKTPHHGECWEYVGACSVFGCQEKTYLRPQAATEITPSQAGRPTAARNTSGRVNR